jgi:hypothetical protein
MIDKNELELKHDINENVSATVNLSEDKQSISADYKISDATILSMSKDDKGSTSAKLSIKF